MTGPDVLVFFFVFSSLLHLVFSLTVLCLVVRFNIEAEGVWFAVVLHNVSGR